MKPITRLLVPALAAAVLAAPHASLGQQVDLNPLVVAVVNGEEITRGQLAQRLITYRGEDGREKAINRRLMLQAAAKGKIAVPDAEVEQKLDELRKKFKSEKDYQEFLTRNGLTEELYRDEFRNTLLIQKVALKDLPITDADLEQLDARMIDAPDRASAEAIIKALLEGANFAQLASQKAMNDNLKMAGGRLKQFLKVELVDVWNAIEQQQLKPGAFTRTPVQLATKNWAVIRLEDRIPVSRVGAVEKERLVAVMTTYRVAEWLDRARASAKIQKNALSEPVVAVVNGEPISREGLAGRLIAYYGQETLKQMVNRAVLLQAAKKLEVTVTDAEAEKRVREIRAQFPDEESFQAFLTRSNLPEKQFRDDLRYTVLMEKVALKESPITEDDLTRYDALMLDCPSRAVGEKWIKELQEGMEFERMCRERAGNPQARISGCRLKPFLRVELLDVWRAIRDHNLKPGEFTRTPVLLTDGSWAIIKLDKLIPSRGLPKEEVARLEEAVTRYRVDQWLNQALARSTFSYPTVLTTAVGRIE